MLIKINPENPQDRLIEKTVQILKKGGIIVYPTDTIYGIGCNIMNKKAIEKIYQIKKLKKNTPLSFICSDLKNVSNYAKVSNFTYRTMKRLLPGPYTFILNASKMVPKTMLTKNKSVGIRVPDNKICIAIVKKIGNPIISTSATTKNTNILSDPSLIKDYFEKKIELFIDGGNSKKKPSTVISLVNDEPKIIRLGLGDPNIF